MHPVIDENRGTRDALPRVSATSAGRMPSARQSHRRRRRARVRARDAAPQPDAVSPRAVDPARRGRSRGRVAGGISRRLQEHRFVRRRREAVDVARAHRHQRGTAADCASASAPGSSCRLRVATAASRMTGENAMPDLVTEQPDAAAMRASCAGCWSAGSMSCRAQFRTVFILRDVEEMTVEETAECLDVPAGDRAHACLPRAGVTARIARAGHRCRHRRTHSSSRESVAIASSPPCSIAWSRSCRVADPRAGKSGVSISSMCHLEAVHEISSDRFRKRIVHRNQRRTRAGRRTTCQRTQRRADRAHRRHRQPGRHRRRQARRIEGQATTTSRRSASRWSPTTPASTSRRSALVTKLKVTPEDNPTSQSLKTGGEDNVDEPEGPEGRGVRQGLHRPRSRLSPAGARRDRQDADPERQERRAEGAARQGASGVRRAPRAREDDPVVSSANSAVRPPFRDRMNAA